MKWKVHHSEKVYQGHFQVTKYQLSHEKFNGDSTDKLNRELVERDDAVAMVAYDPNSDEIVLVEQFRVGAIREEQPWLTEVVAGLIEEGESPEQVTIRESEEEIGCTPSELIKIGEFYTSPGGHSEWVHLYIGKVSAKEAQTLCGLEHEGEDIRVSIVPASDVAYMLSTGEVRSAIAIIGLQWFLMNRENIRPQWLD